MRDYINYHIEKRILGYIPMQRRSMRIGQIVNFYYPNAPHTIRPHVIILNPKFEDLTHGLLLNQMSMKAVDKFRKFILNEVKEVEEDTPKGTGLYGWGRIDRFIPALRKLSTESQTPRSFYHVRLRPYFDREGVDFVYRTYKWDEIKNLRLVAYRFGKN